MTPEQQAKLAETARRQRTLSRSGGSSKVIHHCHYYVPLTFGPAFIVAELHPQ